MTQSTRDIPVVILCGGQGVVLASSNGERTNKALIEIHGKPLVWWVTLQYALQGSRDFILAVGLQFERVRTALIQQCGANVDDRDPQLLRVQMGKLTVEMRLVETPIAANTAERLMAAKPYVESAPHFALSYSDTLSDVDLQAELAFHEQSRAVATLVATQFPIRFRILGMRQGESLVRAFASKPVIEASAINGGFYIFTQEIWSPAFAVDGRYPLETIPLENLAAQSKLTAFEHRGAWQHYDSERDFAPLQAIAEKLAANLTSR